MITRIQMGSSCWVLVLAGIAGAMGIDRELPPTEVQPRARAAWQALMAERAGHGPFPEAYPEYAPQFEAMKQRMAGYTPRFLRDGLVYDQALAEELLEEFYVDAGHPLLNGALQDIVMDTIRVVAQWPPERLPEHVRRRFADGLLEYVDAGGGQYFPSMQARVAETVAAMALPDDAEARQYVELLLTDALAWAHEIGGEIEQEMVRRIAKRQWGDTIYVYEYELELGRGALPPRPPKRYTRAVADLTAVLTDRTADGERLYKLLRSAAEGALEPLSDRNLNDDLTCRVLIVCRALLARRPMVAEKVAEYVQDRLLWLAAASRRLTSDRHWRLWAEAVGELGSRRASERTKSFVRELLERKDLPDARRAAIEPARALLRGTQQEASTKTPEADKQP